MKRPWMPLYVNDFINSEDVINMPPEACGIYIKLLCHNWESGDLPADPDLLAKMVRINPRTFRRLWPIIQPLFPEIIPGRLGNHRVVNELKTADEKSEKSRKAAQTRHSDHADALPTQHSTTQYITAEETHTTAATPPREFGQASLVLVHTDPEFDLEAIYAAFPRKGDGKAKGIERLRKQIKTRDAYEQALQAARHYAEKTQAEQTPLQYVKRFDTWSNGHWRDYVDGPHIAERLTGAASKSGWREPMPHQAETKDETNDL